MPSSNAFGHVGVIPPVAVTDVPRLGQMWLEHFATCSASDVADEVGPLYVMCSDIRPLYRPMPTVVGQALTVKCWPGDNLAVFGALSMAQDGDVLVIDNRGNAENCGSGSNTLEQPRGNGLRGVIIDGAWRDVDVLEEQRFPIFGRGRSAVSPSKQFPGEINVPVNCGGVVVQPGDLIVGDADGVAVTPRAYVEQVWRRIERRRARNQDAEAASAAAAHRRAQFFADSFDAAGGHRAVWPIEV